MSTLYPIIRRVRRALLPPEEVRLVEKVEPPSPQPSDSVAPAPSALGGPSLGANSFRRFPSDSSPPGEGAARAVVELPPVVADSQSSPHGESQSLLTSAATKATKGKRQAAKSRVKAIDEAHSDQP